MVIGIFRDFVMRSYHALAEPISLRSRDIYGDFVYVIGPFGTFPLYHWLYFVHLKWVSQIILIFRFIFGSFVDKSTHPQHEELSQRYGTPDGD